MLMLVDDDEEEDVPMIANCICPDGMVNGTGKGKSCNDRKENCFPYNYRPVSLIINLPTLLP